MSWADLIKTRDVKDVSIVSLVTNGTKYNSEWVSLTGYFYKERDVFKLCSSEFTCHADGVEQLNIGQTHYKSAELEDYVGCYVSLTAQFEAKESSGLLNKVTPVLLAIKTRDFFKYSNCRFSNILWNNIKDNKVKQDEFFEKFGIE